MKTKSIAVIIVVLVYFFPNKINAQSEPTLQETKDWIISKIKSNFKNPYPSYVKFTLISVDIDNGNIIVTYHYEHQITGRLKYYDGSYTIPIYSINIDKCNINYIYSNCNCITIIDGLDGKQYYAEGSQVYYDNSKNYKNNDIPNFINFDGEVNLEARFKKALYRLKTFYPDPHNNEKF